MPDEEELRVLDTKVKQLKLDYDRYFLGSRPREPMVLRSEVDKLIAIYSNQAITNMGLRFRFSSICSRYQALKRQWMEILRQMEQGTYARHRFRADLHDRERVEVPAAGAGAGGAAPPPPPQAAPAREAGSDGLYEQYRAARRRCGQDADGVTPAALERVLAQQRETLRQKFGNAEFRFRVVVEDGRAKIKASRVGTP